MRALAPAFAIGVLAATLALTAPSARADGPSTTPAGFDHNLHARNVAVSGGEDLPCTRCHVMKNGLLVGRPDHAACFGTCHGPAPAPAQKGLVITLDPARLQLCANCHAEAVLVAPIGKTVPVNFPPYIPTDFMPAANHKQHRDLACASCHLAVPAPSKRGTPHKRCLGCHDGSKAPQRGPAMTACQGCHTPGSGSPQPPKLAEPKNTVTSTFAHDKHATRGALGAQCTTCHAEIRDTDDSILPRPKAASCAVAGCHDGQPAFPITAACTRCHTTPPAGRFDVDRDRPRFSHLRAEHTQLACAACHPLGSKGEVLVADHTPCVGCHAAEFGQRDPNICRACHNSTDPWRKLTADRAPREDTEFGATLPHASHGQDCTACHSLRTQTSQLRPPRGHKACTGTSCHAVGSGPAPQLASCDGCHRLGRAAERVKARLAAAWSARAKFDHAVHTTGKDGNDLACTTCHADLTATDVLALATPQKLACAGCHDGRTAFKVTGTGCTKCHPGATR